MTRKCEPKHIVRHVLFSPSAKIPIVQCTVGIWLMLSFQCNTVPGRARVRGTCQRYLQAGHHGCLAG